MAKKRIITSDLSIPHPLKKIKKNLSTLELVTLKNVGSFISLDNDASFLVNNKIVPLSLDKIRAEKNYIIYRCPCHREHKTIKHLLTGQSAKIQWSQISSHLISDYQATLDSI